MRSLLVATAFLTRVPVSIEATASDVRAAMRWFPAVGAALGVVEALVSLGLARIDVPPLVSAALVITLEAWATGAIHLDGLADTADGFGGGRTKDDVLRIMRDPRVGSFGAIALTLVLVIKITTLAVLIERAVDVLVLIAASTLSRWTVVALGGWLPYARPDGGLGEVATDARGATGFLIATIIAIAVSLGAAGASAVALWAGTLMTVGAVGRLASRQIGGVTGDVFGATVELSETAVLIAGLLVSRRA